jgi:hypothetical protein
LNPGRGGGKPATNRRLSYGAAFMEYKNHTPLQLKLDNRSPFFNGVNLYGRQLLNTSRNENHLHTNQKLRISNFNYVHSGPSHLSSLKSKFNQV